jgi:hypothetical protein
MGKVGSEKSLPTNSFPSSNLNRARSLTLMYPWSPCGSLPSTACFPALTCSHPITSFLSAQATFLNQPFPYKYPTFSSPLTLHTCSSMKMEQTASSEILAFKLQTPVNNPEESIRHSEQGEILKSRVLCFLIFMLLDHASCNKQINSL